MINAWFDLRYVCDDDNFPRFFRRLLIQDYFQYQEMLRLQPGYAHYDWLVTMYQEQQTLSKTASSDDSITNESRAKTGSDTTASEGSSGKAGQVVVTDGGDETSKTSYGSATTRSGSQDDSETYDDYHEITDETGTTSYGKRTESTPGAETKSVTHYQDADGSRDTQTDSDVSVAKAAPQSISYAGASAGEIPALSWEYPSSQAQDKKISETIHGQNNTSETTNSYVSGSDTTEDSGEDGSTGHRDTERLGTINRNTIYNDVTDEKTGDDTQTVTFGKTVTTSYDGMQDTNINSQTVTYGSGEDHDSRTQTTGKTQGEQTLQSTGRNGNIAAILTEAQGFIQTSNAWAWLKQELESVFWGIYDIEYEV